MRGLARRAAAALGAVLLAVGAARAQVPDARVPDAQLPNAQLPTAPAPEPGSELTVMLLTIGPGDQVWQRFGHNAIWIRDAARGIDVAYNWGMFDFEQPNFLSRFLTGDTRYWMEPFDARALVAHYADVENRSVWVQELNLTPAQREALREFVTWNARDENKYYRYDYYLDNCSTRVRDALDRVVGGAIRQTIAARRTGTTFRSHTRRLTDGMPAVYSGIQLALGRPADREITAWEEGFLPVRLMRHLRDVRVPGSGPNGATVPLVRSERQLYEARRPPEPETPRSHLVGYLAAGLGVGALLILLARGAAGGRRGAAAAFGVLGGLWTLTAGVAGTALLLAGTVTRHAFMGRNFNLAAISPLALLLLALVVVAVGLRSVDARRRWAGRAERAASLVAALGVVGWLGALALGQRSGEIFALALPLNVALWWGLRRLAAR